MKTLSTLFRTKPLQHIDANLLSRCLTATDLTLLGIGAVIGAGIFVLTGIAAATKAGPAIMLSYMLAGMASAFSALSYAELAASIGGCGSVYGYAYAGFGEIIAWLIGWDLLLEYWMSCVTVAIGWSGYVENALTAIGLPLPAALSKAPNAGGIINLPAVLIILILMALLAIGVRQSTKFNNIIVFIKLITIVIFIAIASRHFNIEYWHPFMPFGSMGIVHGAALIFFAYIGFDALATAEEEAINPQRNMPISILTSLAVCTLIYMIVAALLTGIAPYHTLNVPSPVSSVLLHLGYRFGAAIVAAGAIAGLTTVVLVMYYGFTRVALAMSRDHLLPAKLGQVNQKTKTPLAIIIIGGVVMSLVAGFVPINHVAELVNIGTLAAFVLVSAGVLFLRYTKPNLSRPFRVPFSPYIPMLGILLSLYLMVALPTMTWLRFLAWMSIGVVIYFAYSRSHSLLKTK